MDFADCLLSALDALVANKLRSALAMLGMIIGVVAVIVLVALGEGARDYVVEQIQGFGFGANTIIIRPGKSGNPMESSDLTYEDCKALAEHIPEITAMSPALVSSLPLRYGPQEHTCMIVGVSETYPEITGWHVAAGHFFTRLDMDASSKVILLGQRVSEGLFGPHSPLGERITVGGEKFTVVGLMQKKGQFLFFDIDDLALIPRSAAQNLFGTKKLAEVLLLVDEGASVPRVVEQIREILMRRHKNREDFHTRTEEEVLSILGNITGALTLFIGAVAAISLIVGGVGIMNIMLVSVTERTREIGIRKSVGARRRDIFMQFLTESVMIGVLGGSLGLAAGYGACSVVTQAMSFRVELPPWAAALGLAFSVLVGIFSGVYPAMRAAALNPITALRYE